MKRFLSVLLAVLVLLLCGCTQEPEPTSIRLPEDMLDGMPETEPPTTASPETTVPPETTPTDITEPDFSEFESLLDASQGINWYHRALGCVFTDPREINLEHLFYNVNFGGWDTISPETAECLLDHGFHREMDIQVRPAKELENILQDYFGISLSDVKQGIPTSWVYVEADDAYYTNHNDAMGLGRVEITWVEHRADGTIQVFYHSEYGTSVNAQGEFFTKEPMVLTLRPKEDGGYHVLSNTVVPQK